MEECGRPFLLIPDKTIYIDYVQFTNEQKDVTERNLRYGVVVAIRQGAEVYVRRLDMINAYNIRTVFSSLDLEIRRSRGCGNSSGGMIKWLNKIFKICCIINLFYQYSK